MDFNLQPSLENDLVQLRPILQSDFKELFSIACDPFLWEQHQNKDRHTIENFTKFFKDAINSKSAFVIVDIKTNKVIGSSRFKILDNDDKVIEIGWSFLGRAYWGGKYNRAFKKLMVNYALGYCNYVVFYVNGKNIRSQRAMEKLGARRIIQSEKTWVLPLDKGVTYVIDSPLKD